MCSFAISLLQLITVGFVYDTVAIITRETATWSNAHLLVTLFSVHVYVMLKCTCTTLIAMFT